MIKPGIKNRAIVLIAAGESDKEISRITGISIPTICRLRIDYVPEIEIIKKAKLAKMADSAAEKLSALATDMLKGSKLAMDLIIEKIREASPAQAAVILGILQDKYGMILGNPSQTIALKFQGREDMLGYIKSGAVPVTVKPIIDVVPENIPKPPRQIAQEYREKARVPARRGRPRIKPLPDPTIPKRGRGRPRRVLIIPISPLEQYIPPVEGKE